MGIFYKKEKFVAKQECSQEAAKTCMACLWSLLVSITGGLVLGFWECQYHPTYRQLWMVPFSLILLVTPVIVWFAVFVSDICNSRNEDTSTVGSLGDSVHDPEK